MSAFVVSDSTINRILSLFRRLDQYHTDRWLNPLLRAAGVTMNDPKIFYKLAVSMHSLNVDAVNDRYEESGLADLKFALKSEVCSKIQAYKSLRCWLYQCSEGEIPSRPLYEAFDQFSAELAMDIVADLPEYERAEWS